LAIPSAVSARSLASSTAAARYFGVAANTPGRSTS
jgi:hypothetical protein